MLKADQGQARIRGYDVVSRAAAVRELIAPTGQFASADDELTGTENLILIGRLLGLSRATARGRAREMAERFGLEAAAGPAQTARRLAAIALIALEFHGLPFHARKVGGLAGVFPSRCRHDLAAAGLGELRGALRQGVGEARR
ncbi:MAG: hypothetical protein ACLPN6_29800 [Streptosporangiaceae bacterium]|nr:hypothetical protein [Actinomycetota bacterium]